METLEEGNVEGTCIYVLIEAGESLVDVSHMTGEPITVVIQETILKLKDNMKKATDNLKPLQQAYTKFPQQGDSWSRAPC